MRNHVLQPPFARNASDAEYPQLWSGMVLGCAANLGMTSTSIRDRSGNSRHMTLQNSTVSLFWTTKGMPSWRWGGSTATSRLEGITPLTAVPITFVLWAIPQLTTANNIAIWLGDSNSGVWDAFYVNFGSSGSVSANLAHNNSFGGVGSTGISANNLYHIVACYGKNLQRLYINGRFVGEGTSTLVPTGIDKFLVGCENAQPGPTYNNFFGGWIFDFRVYSTMWASDNTATDFSLGPGGWASHKSPASVYVPIQTRPPLRRTRSITPNQCVDIQFRHRNIGHGRLKAG